MPYPNVPDDRQADMESCVQQVMQQGHDKEAAIAICYTSIVGKESNPMSELFKSIAAVWEKYGARHSKTDNENVQSIHDSAVSLGAECPRMMRAAREVGSAFVVFKAVDGWRWLGVVTNKYKDLEGEILVDRSHKEFIAWLDKNTDKAPELWSWHTKGTARKARADWWDYTPDGFLWMSGPLTENEAKQFEPSEILKMSHGFKAVKNATDIVFYRTFEVSELPASEAANPWTDFTMAKGEKGMAFTPEKREFLVKRFGEEKVKELEASEAATTKELNEAGVQFKNTTTTETKQEPGEEVPAAPVGADPMAILQQCMTICQQCATVCLQCASVCAGLTGDAAAKCVDACSNCAKACKACSDSCAAVMSEMGAAQQPAMQVAQAQQQPGPMVATAPGNDVAALARSLDKALALGETVKALAEQTAALQKQSNALAEMIKALQTSKDEEIAKAINPRVAPVGGVVNQVPHTPATNPVVQQMKNSETFSWIKDIGPLA